MAAGSIVIDLLLRTGSFSTDTERAAKDLRKLQKEAEQAGKAIGAAFAGTAVASTYLVKSSIDAADAMSKLSQSAGLSVEALSGLAYAADLSGVNHEELGAAIVKLSKNMSDARAGVGDAVRGFTALGISLERADGTLKSADDVLKEIADKFAGFSDGAEKTALAVNTLGKSGAQLIPLLNGGSQSIEDMRVEAEKLGLVIGTDFAHASEAFNDNLTRMQGAVRGVANRAAAELLPALTDISQAFVAMAKSEEFFSTTSAVVKSVIGGLVNVFQTISVVGSDVGFVFTSVGREIGAWAAQINALAHGDLQGFTAISDAVKEDGKRAREELDKFQARVMAIGKPGLDLSGFARTAASFGTSTPAKPAAPAIPGTIKPKTDTATEADRYLDRLRQQVQKTQDLTEVEKLLDDIQAGRFKNAKAGQIEEAVRLADELDGAKALADATKKEIELAEERERQSQALRDAGRHVFDDTRTAAEAYAIELERINKLMQAGALGQGAQAAETYARAVAQLQERFDENVRQQKENAAAINQAFEGAFSNAFEGFIDGSISAKDAFKSFANSVIQDLLRIYSQRLAQQIFGGGQDGTGGIGSLLSQLGNAASSYFNGGFGTGSSFGNQDYGAFLATGTNYVPHDGFRATLHKGEAVVPAKYNPANGAGGGTLQVINPPGVPLGVKYQEERQPDGQMLKKLVLSVMQEDARTGGPGSQALASTFGLRRQLPRRGT